MKKFFFMLLTSLIFFGFSQEHVYCDLEHVLRVSDNIIKEKFCAWPDGEEQLFEYPYKTESIGGITYYFFNNKKYLVLSCPELFYAFESNGKIKYMLNSKGGMASEVISTLCKDDCEYSSALKENGKEYAFSINDGYNPKLREPWVEGKKGYGFGEWISFSQTEVHNIFISIGFVDYDKPNLYYENSRPKKVRLYIDEKPVLDIDLKDTPNFQRIRIPEEYVDSKTRKIKIQILDVYKGTKYDDTCFNMIVVDEAGIK